jgi:hypothetical protein
MKNLLPVLMVGLTLLAMDCNAAETSMPDCLGIRPGMTVTEASQRLKSYDPKLPVLSVDLQIPKLSQKPLLGTLMVRRMAASPPDGGFPLETLQAAITLPPSQPVVWKVFRSLWFEPGHEPTKTALFAALRDKYGKESVTFDLLRGRAIYRYWVLGADGNLLEGQAAEECSTFFREAYEISFSMESLGQTNIGFPSDIRDVRPLAQDKHHCQAMTYVVAELGVAADGEIVKTMRVAVVDAALDFRAREATLAVIKPVEAEMAKQQLEKAKQELEKAKRQEVPKL